MKSIPTMYYGRRFRSRLEARWAATFDLLGWRYEYEPYDLNGWIPDFALFGAEEVIVEVKPYSSLQEFDIGKIIAALKGSKKRGKEILLLGFSIWENGQAVILGWLGEFRSNDSYYFGQGILNYYEGKWGFYHEEGYWGDRMTGLYDGDHYHSHPDYENVLIIWNQAGNIVQYKG